MKTKQENTPKQYFSKWRGIWVDFKKEPTQGEIYVLKKYHYKLR
jgi:hypothetical protein